MNKKQIVRAWRKLIEHLTRGDGYQPYGYDIRTLEVRFPGTMAAWDRLLQLYRKAKQ